MHIFLIDSTQNVTYRFKLNCIFDSYIERLVFLTFWDVHNIYEIEFIYIWNTLAAVKSNVFLFTFFFVASLFQTAIFFHFFCFVVVFILSLYVILYILYPCVQQRLNIIRDTSLCSNNLTMHMILVYAGGNVTISHCLALYSFDFDCVLQSSIFFFPFFSPFWLAFLV